MHEVSRMRKFDEKMEDLINSSASRLAPAEAKEPAKETGLLPCPFCGGNPYCGKDSKGWAVLCASMKCDVSPTTTYHDSEQEAIAAWNTRATPAPLTEAWISERLPAVAKTDNCCITEEEAPTVSDPVLVWDEDDCERIVAELELTEEKTYIWRSRETGKRIYGVSHWQPLPSPPVLP